MAEIAGLVVGSVALAALCTNTLHLFKRISSAKDADDERRRMILNLDHCKSQLENWGKSIDLWQPRSSSIRWLSTSDQSLAFVTLVEISLLINEITATLKDDEEKSVKNALTRLRNFSPITIFPRDSDTSSQAIALVNPGQETVKHVLEIFKTASNRDHKLAHRQKLSWAFWRREEVQSKLGVLRGLIGDLRHLIPSQCAPAFSGYTLTGELAASSREYLEDKANASSLGDEDVAHAALVALENLYPSTQATLCEILKPYEYLKDGSAISQGVYITQFQDPGKKREVVVEWRSVGRAETSVLFQQIERETAQMSAVLHKLSALPHALTLDSSGVVSKPNASQPRIGLIYELPATATRGTEPLSISQAIANVPQDSPNLAKRLQLAHSLARAIHTTLVARVLHKAIRSGNIICFTYGGSPPFDFDQPYLVGFESSRFAAPGQISIKTEDMTWDSYHHPAYNTVEKRQFISYRETFDIYSLGIVLLEVALWASVQGEYDQYVDDGGESEFEAFLEEELVGRRLGFLVGPIWERAVKWCLYGTSHLDEQLAQAGDEDSDDRNEYRRQLLDDLVSYVLSPLAQCAV